jgi:hypothetical protein
MSKPVARGSVLVHLPYDEVERDFARDVGEQAEGETRIARAAEGRYHTESRAGLARVLGEFVLERADVDETVVHATLWVRPRVFGVLARVVLGRKRLQRGVDAALVRMARSATGDDQLDAPPPEDSEEAHFQSGTPPD